MADIETHKIAIIVKRGGNRGGSGKKKIPDAKEITLKVPAPLVKVVKEFVSKLVKQYKKDLK